MATHGDAGDAGQSADGRLDEAEAELEASDLDGRVCAAHDLQPHS